MTKTVHVGKARQVAQRYRLVRQQCARQQGQRSVFRAGDGKTAVERIAAANMNTIHRLGLNVNCATRKARHARQGRQRAVAAVPGNICTILRTILIEFSARAANAAKRQAGRSVTVTTMFSRRCVEWQQVASRKG